MKADIQSQIAVIDEQIIFPEFHDYTKEFLRRRKNFLNIVLNTPVWSIGEKAVEFVYGPEK